MHCVPKLWIQLTAHLTCIDHNAISTVVAEMIFFKLQPWMQGTRPMKMNIRYCKNHCPVPCLRTASQKVLFGWKPENHCSQPFVNPRRAGAPKLPWSARGGASRHPPSNSAPRRRSEKQKTPFKRPSKTISKLLRSLFRSGRYWGHQRLSNVKFREISYFFRKCAVISETIKGKRLRKSAIDSPWAALSPKCRQIWAILKRLGYRGQEISK